MSTSRKRPSAALPRKENGPPDPGNCGGKAAAATGAELEEDCAATGAEKAEDRLAGVPEEMSPLEETTEEAFSPPPLWLAGAGEVLVEGEELATLPVREEELAALALEDELEERDDDEDDDALRELEEPGVSASPEVPENRESSAAVLRPCSS